MKPKTRQALVGAAKSLGWGFVIAGGASAFVFVFAFLTNSFSWAIGLEWVRRIVYVLGALGLIVGAVGLLFGGAEYTGSRIRFATDEASNQFKHAAGISWPAAICVGSVAFFVVGTVLDLLYVALLY